jgi:hypothetical protein
MLLIMEAASEKPRRGRPPKIPPELLKNLPFKIDHLTVRQQHEHAYAFLAATKLMEDPKFAWLFEPHPRISLLAELGRLGEEDPELAVAAAETLCEKRSSTTKSRALLRRARLGKDADRRSFTLALAKAADDYIRRHGQPSKSDIQEALFRLEQALTKPSRYKD